MLTFLSSPKHLIVKCKQSQLLKNFEKLQGKHLWCSLYGEAAGSAPLRKNSTDSVFLRILINFSEQLLSTIYFASNRKTQETPLLESVSNREQIHKNQ